MRRFLLVLLLLILLAGGYSAWVLSRPLPTLEPHNVIGTIPAGQAVQLAWPAFGEAALGAQGYGLLEMHGAQKQLPTASTAKLVTALAVLGKKPLAPGTPGPLLTLGDQDIQYYNNYVAEEGSVVPVNYGEQISEYQALQALLLPSANNMAESLATWAFGSVQAYTAYANTFVKQLGMTHTHIADASGFSPDTTSTAADLVRLGIASMKNPVLAEVVAQKQADIPVAGTVYNMDSLLGTDGVNGIKTGNTDQDGGVFLGSGTYTLSGHSATIITAIMGGSSLGQTLQATPPLLRSAQAGFAKQTPVHKGEIVGYYNTPWNTSTNIVAASDLTTFGWKEKPAVPTSSLQPANVNTPAGKKVGTVTLLSGSSALHTDADTQALVKPPSWQWRLLHP